MKKLLSVFLALTLVFALCGGALAAEETTEDLAGQIVILHTNDVHGAIDGYAMIAAMKSDYEARGADVLLFDAGDYIQGDPSVSISQGATAIELMNLAGYDLAGIGNHEFDYGYENLMTHPRRGRVRHRLRQRLQGRRGAVPQQLHLHHRGRRHHRRLWPRHP